MCLLLYVIDMLNTSNNMSEINNLKDRFSGDFEMKDLGVAKKNWVWRCVAIKALTNYTYPI